MASRASNCFFGQFQGPFWLIANFCALLSFQSLSPNFLSNLNFGRSLRDIQICQSLWALHQILAGNKAPLSSTSQRQGELWKNLNLTLLIEGLVCRKSAHDWHSSPTFVPIISVISHFVPHLSLWQLSLLFWIHRCLAHSGVFEVVREWSTTAQSLRNFPFKLLSWLLRLSQGSLVPLSPLPFRPPTGTHP